MWKTNFFFITGVKYYLPIDGAKMRFQVCVNFKMILKKWKKMRGIKKSFCNLIALKPFHMTSVTNFMSYPGEIQISLLITSIKMLRFSLCSCSSSYCCCCCCSPFLALQHFNIQIYSFVDYISEVNTSYVCAIHINPINYFIHWIFVK